MRSFHWCEVQQRRENEKTVPQATLRSDLHSDLKRRTAQQFLFMYYSLFFCLSGSHCSYFFLCLSLLLFCWHSSGEPVCKRSESWVCQIPGLIFSHLVVSLFLSMSLSQSQTWGRGPERKETTERRQGL